MRLTWANKTRFKREHVEPDIEGDRETTRFLSGVIIRFLNSMFGDKNKGMEVELPIIWTRSDGFRGEPVNDPFEVYISASLDMDHKDPVLKFSFFKLLQEMVKDTTSGAFDIDTVWLVKMRARLQEALAMVDKAIADNEMRH